MIFSKKFLYITLVNILIFFSLIAITEIFFGYWFKENNFGIHMRSERNKVIEFTKIDKNSNKIEFTHKRNFYGFIDDEFDPKEVKIIFEGGSTGAEIWKPKKESIVENLNYLLKLDNSKKKIYNASVNGKSIRGFVYDFNHWFKKIPNFNPDYVIFYLGINDRKFPDDELHRFYDHQHSIEKIKMLRDYIKNNSFFLGKIKKIENKFFPKNKIIYNRDKENLYKDFNYINYAEAEKLYSGNINSGDKEFLTVLNNRLENLNKVINQGNFTPIFITQIMFNGISEKRLYLISN